MTGSNPEKSNIHKKRFVVMKEPPKCKKIKNSVYKELTGGGSFSARGHHETKTEKQLHNTIVMECNSRPLFAEEPEDADVGRIIDIYFGSYFTDDTKEMNRRIKDGLSAFKVNKEYKTDDFQNNHKRALIKILIEKYKNYAKNGHKLKIPDHVKQRTDQYLESSCDILTWFKDNYEFSNNKKDIVKLKDVYEKYKYSDYYYNLPKTKKREQNYRFFIEYFSKNIFFRSNFFEKYGKITNGIYRYVEKSPLD